MKANQSNKVTEASKMYEEKRTKTVQPFPKEKILESTVSQKSQEHWDQALDRLVQVIMDRLWKKEMEKIARESKSIRKVRRKVVKNTWQTIDEGQAR